MSDVVIKRPTCPSRQPMNRSAAVLPRRPGFELGSSCVRRIKHVALREFAITCDGMNELVKRPKATACGNALCPAKARTFASAKS